MTNIRIIALLIFLVSANALSDDWPTPTPRIVASPDTSIFVRVVWPEATYYKRNSRTNSYDAYLTITLPRRIAPVDLFVGNDGVVVLLDEWGSIGFGSAVSIVDPNGVLVRSYSLEDIYTAEAIDEIPATVSSRWWRDSQTTPRFTEEGLSVKDRFDNKIFFDLADGSLNHRGAQPCRFKIKT